VIIRSAGQRPVSRIIGSSFLWDPTAIQAKHATGDLLGTSAGASASLTHARFLGFDAVHSHASGWRFCSTASARSRHSLLFSL
jgi:hypothetical protein